MRKCTKMQTNQRIANAKVDTWKRSWGSQLAVLANSAWRKHVCLDFCATLHRTSIIPLFNAMCARDYEIHEINFFCSVGNDPKKALPRIQRHCLVSCFIQCWSQIYAMQCSIGDKLNQNQCAGGKYIESYALYIAYILKQCNAVFAV